METDSPTNLANTSSMLLLVLVAPMSAAKSSEPNTSATGQKTEAGSEARSQAARQMRSMSRSDLAVSMNMMRPRLPLPRPTASSVTRHTSSSYALSLTLGRWMEDGRLSPPRTVLKSS